MSGVSPERFRRCVARYKGNYKVSEFSCWDQFLAMAFAQITYRENPSDVEICLRSRRDQLFHMGFRSSVARSTLADANRVRDWRIYAELAQGLIDRARRLYADEPLGGGVGISLKQNLRIRHFFDTTDNAVMTQVWIAICVYVLVAILRKEHAIELSLSQLLQVLSVNAFEQVPLLEMVTKTASQDLGPNSRNQLMVWN
jgi:hypothetical protein